MSTVAARRAQEGSTAHWELTPIEFERCGLCGTPLTNEASRQRGFGPECAELVGAITPQPLTEVVIRAGEKPAKDHLLPGQARPGLAVRAPVNGYPGLRVAAVRPDGLVECQMPGGARLLFEAAALSFDPPRLPNTNEGACERCGTALAAGWGMLFPCHGAPGCERHPWRGPHLYCRDEEQCAARQQGADSAFTQPGVTRFGVNEPARGTEA